MGSSARKLAHACLMVGMALGTSGSVLADDRAAPADLPVEQVEKIVRDYMLREPEIIYQALQELQRREAAATAARQRAAILANQSELLDAAHTPTGGNPDGDVTLVEFFDYRCAYCRRVVSSMQALLDEDRNLRVMFKELPVLGPDSVRAARAALASRKQGGYVPFHFALMTTDDLSIEGIRVAAKAVGLDPDQLEADMTSPEVIAAIEANYALANELGIEGTPAFVIGDQLVPGAVDKARLDQLIREARSG
jgi:protein-disulfide isomerase